MPDTEKSFKIIVKFTSKISNESKVRIKTVICIPTYNEAESLPKLIGQLAPLLNPTDLILILDDSSKNQFIETKLLVEAEFKHSLGQILISNTSTKSGRGSAVNRGMSYCYRHFPNMIYFVECDGDGSHQLRDILCIKDFEMVCDLLVGSRYLPQSEIIGWPKSRRIFSYLLNRLIPYIFKLPISDVTNGLRRYSRKAMGSILDEIPINSGFIYLTEQALIIQRNNLSIKEVPISFVNRTAGKSTITLRDILLALKGLFNLIVYKVGKA